MVMRNKESYPCYTLESPRELEKKWNLLSDPHPDPWTEVWSALLFKCYTENFNRKSDLKTNGFLSPVCLDSASASQSPLVNISSLRIRIPVWVFFPYQFMVGNARVILVLSIIFHLSFETDTSPQIFPENIAPWKYYIESLKRKGLHKRRGF